MTSPTWTRFTSMFGLALALGAAVSATGCTLGGGDGDDGGDDDQGIDDGSGDDAHAPFFLPTGEPDNTAAPTVEIDQRGRIHAVYPGYAGGDAYYATCTGECAGPEDFDVARLTTGGSTVSNIMLALDAGGRPSVLMNTFLDVVYATCDSDCGKDGSWKQTTIIDHGGDRDVTGPAFALDADGDPHFVMHTYVAYLGVGQKTPETLWVSCEGDCHDPASWKQSHISDQIWQSNALRFDSKGRAKLATVAHVLMEDQSTGLVGAYLECDGDCTKEDAWKSAPLENAFHTDFDALPFPPAISLALTDDDRPRVAIIGQDDASQRRVTYFECDADCATDTSWKGIVLSDLHEIGPGIDIAIDGKGEPRIAYTLDYNIGILHCEGDDCTAQGAAWDVAKVELSGEMDPDTIFLEENCHVAAWFLHTPSIALSEGGAPRVGYQARDISGGWDNPDHDEPDCVAGTDMTWSRFAQLSAM